MKKWICLLALFPLFALSEGQSRSLKELNEEISKINRYMSEGIESPELNAALKKLKAEKRALQGAPAKSASQNAKSTLKVKSQASSKLAPRLKKQFGIQVAAYRSSKEAAERSQALTSLGLNGFSVPVSATGWHRVGLGPFSSRKEASVKLAELMSKNIISTGLVRQIGPGFTPSFVAKKPGANSIVASSKAPLQKAVATNVPLTLRAPEAGASLAEAGGQMFSSNLSLLTNYIWRGQTQTNNAAAIQGGIDFAHPSGISTGVWASNVTGGSEVDFVAGYAYRFDNGVELGLGGVFYHYTLAPVSDTFETRADFGLGNLRISVAHTDKFFGKETSSYYTDASYRFGLEQKPLSLEVAIGRTTFDDELKAETKGYVDHRVSLFFEADGYEMGIHWTDTNRISINPSTQVETPEKDQNFFLSISTSL